MRAWTGLAALCLLLATGCREELGPERMETARVSGLILDAGEPVRGGWVEFLPVDGTVGNLRSAPIGTDGRFEATGVAVGKNLVGLAGRLPQVLRPRYVDAHGRSIRFDSFSSPIRRTIPAGGLKTLKIDLAAEAGRIDEGARASDHPVETQP